MTDTTARAGASCIAQADAIEGEIGEGRFPLESASFLGWWGDRLGCDLCPFGALADGDCRRDVSGKEQVQVSVHLCARRCIGHLVGQSAIDFGS